MVLPKQRRASGSRSSGGAKTGANTPCVPGWHQVLSHVFSFRPLSNIRKWVKLFPLQGEEVEAKREKSDSPKVIQ